MKHTVVSLLIVLSFFLQSSLIAQIVTSKAENTAIGNTAKGFYYSLPQTVLRIDLVYEKLESRKGPLSSYTNEYLGITDYISSNDTEYKLLDVKVTSSVEPDPNELYFVQYPSERPKDAKPIAFYLNDLGGLSGYNLQPSDDNSNNVTENEINYFYSEGDKRFNYFAQYNKSKKTDTIVRQISIDTVVIDRFYYKTSWVDKTSEDKAKEAALQIEKLRESRYNLVSGYHEVNFGTSLAYMDNQLKQMEKQYLELFVGKTSRSIESTSIYYIPEKTGGSDEIFRFSDGTTVILNLTEIGSGKQPQSPQSTQNSIFYRIPLDAMMEISSDNTTFFSDRLTVNQFGSVVSAPVDNTKLLFERETGNILSIQRD